MAFLQLQKDDLEYSEFDDGALEVELPAFQSSFNILDQIKRSAGSTPAKSHGLSAAAYNKASDFSHQMLFIENSATELGFVGFGTGLTESTSASSTGDSYIRESFSLFQSSSINAKTDGNGVAQDRKDYVSESMNISNDLVEIKLPQRIAGLISRNILIDDMGSPVTASRENESLSPQSCDERNSIGDSTFWEESNDRGDSLFDNTDGEDEDEDTCTSTIREDDDDFDDDDDDCTYEESARDGQNQLSAVESFLDELADVDDIDRLSKLLYRVGVGGCNHPDANAILDDDDYRHGDDDDTATYNSHPELHQFYNGSNQPTIQDQTSIVAATRTSSGTSGKRQNDSHPQNLPVAVSIDDTDDNMTMDSFSLNQIFQNWSLQADSIMDIVANSTIRSHTDDVNDDFDNNTTAGKIGTFTEPTEHARATSSADDKTRFSTWTLVQSMFNCHQGG